MDRNKDITESDWVTLCESIKLTIEGSADRRKLVKEFSEFHGIFESTAYWKIRTIENVSLIQKAKDLKTAKRIVALSPSGRKRSSGKTHPMKIEITHLIERRDHARDLMLQREKSCTYCGDFYECRDHVIPVSWTGLPRRYAPGDVIPSCNECNTFLGDVPIFNIPERAAYLIPIYRDRRWKWLRFPKWTDGEVSHLGYGLKVSVERRGYLQKVYEAKIANLELVSNYGEAISI